MKSISSIMAMHARNKQTWFYIPAGVLGAGFVICLLITLIINSLFGDATPLYLGAVASIYFVILITGILCVVGTFPFAIGLGARRRDFVLGALAMGGAVSAIFSILIGALSFIEGDVFKNWGIGLHFFHLPVFSDGAPLRQFCWSYYHDAFCAHADPNYVNGANSLGQFWVYFVFMLFLFLVGLLIGAVYERFGSIGEYLLTSIVLLSLTAIVIASAYFNWWGTIGGWLANQTAAGLVAWLIPLIAICALGSYALLRKASV